jgi:hypothetical protein
MASIPSGVGVWWPLDNSAIPENWTRNTDFDTRYPKGTAAGVDPDVTGGSATHQHTSPGHLHSTSAHSHSGNSANANQPYYHWPGSSRQVGHYHSFTTGTSSAADASSDSSSWATADQQPPFFQCIYIESDGEGDGFPDDCLAYFNSTTPPTDWTQHTSSVDKFIVGAAGSSGNGGGSGNGIHQHTDSSHTHTYSNHTHPSGSLSPYGVSTGARKANTPGTMLAKNYSQHTFSVSTSSGGQASGGTSSAATVNTTHEPEHVIMQSIQNTSGDGSWPEGIIAMWLGTLSNIPTDDGWLLCDGSNSTRDLRGKQIKNSASGGVVGGTGGTAGHDHTDPGGHTHTATHSHSGISSTNSGGNGSLTGTVNWTPNGGHLLSHNHNATITNTGGSLASVAKTVDALANTEPLFRTVAFISSPEGPSSGNNSMLFGSNL